MKFKLQFLTATLWLALLAPACGQGTFQNLKFENPILPLDQLYVPITNALPGWTGYIGSNQVDWVLYNTVSLGDAAISLQGPGSLRPILQGSYTVLLQPNYPSYQIWPAIGQVGTIPSTAQSLRFYVAQGAFSVSFASQPISLSVLGSGVNYDIYGGDISMFAGQSGELRFVGGGYLDNIWFSASPIPEPSTFALLAFGALLLGWHLRRQHKS